MRKNKKSRNRSNQSGKIPILKNCKIPMKETKDKDRKIHCAHGLEETIL